MRAAAGPAVVTNPKQRPKETEDIEQPRHYRDDDDSSQDQLTGALQGRTPATIRTTTS